MKSGHMEAKSHAKGPITSARQDTERAQALFIRCREFLEKTAVGGKGRSCLSRTLDDLNMPDPYMWY